MRKKAGKIWIIVRELVPLQPQTGNPVAGPAGALNSVKACRDIWPGGKDAVNLQSPRERARE